METLCHFQSECLQFEANRTAAHHAIARSTVAALKDLRLTNWTFYYETSLDKLPFNFAWASEEEQQREQDRRPDGVAWNPILGAVIFLEFTRAMDNPDNMAAALVRKGAQYDAAVAALQRAQRSREHRHATAISSVSTAPLIYGVRGTVLIDEARDSLQQMRLTEPQLRRALTAGVRAAISGASEMCTARTAALRCLPAKPRLPNGRTARVHIPQKPFKAGPWRRERGRMW